MSLQILSVPAVVLVGITALTLLLVTDWRWSLIALLVQYLGVFILVGLSWPLGMAGAKFVAGGMAVGVLWLAELSLVQQINEGETTSAGQREIDGQLILSGLLFRLFAAIMVSLVVLSSQSIILEWIPELDPAQAISSLLLIGLGLLHLGVDSRPFGVVLGLLTVLCGFEIVYASVEKSALVEGMLAAVTLALALTCAYLILAPEMGETA